MKIRKYVSNIEAEGKDISENKTIENNISEINNKIDQYYTKDGRILTIPHISPDFGFKDCSIQKIIEQITNLAKLWNIKVGWIGIICSTTISIKVEKEGEIEDLFCLIHQNLFKLMEKVNTVYIDINVHEADNELNWCGSFNINNFRTIEIEENYNCKALTAFADLIGVDKSIYIDKSKLFCKMVFKQNGYISNYKKT